VSVLCSLDPVTPVLPVGRRDHPLPTPTKTPLTCGIFSNFGTTLGRASLPLTVVTGKSLLGSFFYFNAQEVSSLRKSPPSLPTGRSRL